MARPIVIDFEKVKLLYFVRQQNGQYMSVCDIAKSLGYNADYIRKVIKKKGWDVARNDKDKKVIEKMVEKTSTREAIVLDKLEDEFINTIQNTSRALNTYSQSIRDQAADDVISSLNDLVKLAGAVEKLVKSHKVVLGEGEDNSKTDITVKLPEGFERCDNLTELDKPTNE